MGGINNLVCFKNRFLMIILCLIKKVKDAYLLCSHQNYIQTLLFLAK